MVDDAVEVAVLLGVAAARARVGVVVGAVLREEAQALRLDGDAEAEAVGAELVSEAARLRVEAR